MEPSRKRLYRLRHNKMVAGVSTGLGEYFDIDPIVFRAMFVLLTFLNGTGVILYIILAIVMPEEPEGAASESSTSTATGQSTGPAPDHGAAPHTENRTRDFVSNMQEGTQRIAEQVKESWDRTDSKQWFASTRNVLGFIIVGIGLLALLGEFDVFRWISWNIIWASIIIIVGLYILFRSNK